MKHFLCRVTLSAALLASFLPLGFIPAYAAETQPTVTINGDPADIHAKYINNELYFSLSDFLTKAAYADPTDIKWDEKEQVLFNGHTVFSVKEQCVYRQRTIDDSGYVYRNDIANFTEPVIYEDDTLWATASFFKDLPSYRTFPEMENGTLNLKKTYWEASDGTPFPYLLPLIPLEKETGRPAFSPAFAENEVIQKRTDFSEDHYHILSQELENGKTVFAYVNKIDPRKFALVTCVDGYVAHVLDHNGIFDSNYFATRSE